MSGFLTKVPYGSVNHEIDNRAIMKTDYRENPTYPTYPPVDQGILKNREGEPDITRHQPDMGGCLVED